MDYDDCIQLFKAVGFLYAEPLVVGSLTDMLSCALGFDSKLPAKLGLTALERNIAEGIVVKPLKNTVLETGKGPRRVIFKRKVENFLERKQRVKGWGRDVRQKNTYDPDFETLKCEMYAMVTEQRVVNVISKQGRPVTVEEWEEVVGGLVSDVLDCLSSENEEAWSKCRKDPGQFEQLLRELREESEQAVQQLRTKQQN